MAGDTTKFLCSLVFLSIVTIGLTQRQCPSNLLKIEQTPTGRKVGSTTEWKVNITNTCTCGIMQLQLLCPNFQSRVKVDPTVISKIDRDHCLINNGQPIYAGTSLAFTYVWNTELDFAPSDYTEACS